MAMTIDDLTKKYGGGATPTPANDNSITNIGQLKQKYLAPTKTEQTSPTLYTSKKNNFTVDDNKLNQWLSADYKLTDEDKKQAREFIQKVDKTNLNRKNKETYNADLRNKINYLNSKAYGGAFASGLMEGINPFYDTVRDKIASDEDKAMYEGIKGQSKGAYTVGKLSGTAMDYALAGKIPGVQKLGSAIGTKLGGGAVANAVGRIGADTLVDVGLDTIPELANNISEGKSGKEITTDALKNIGTNVAFNVGGELIGQGFDALKRAKSARKAVDLADNAVDAVKSSDVVEEVAKNAPNEVKGLSNKEIENILSDTSAKEAFKAESGIDLTGTKAEQRKAIKDYINGQTKLPEIETVAKNVETPKAPTATNNIPTVENATSGDTGISKVYSNTLTKNNVVDLANDVDRRAAAYNIVHEKDTLAKAKERFESNPQKWLDDYISGAQKISDGSDVDTSMMLLLDNRAKKKALQDASVDPAELLKNEAERSLLSMKVRQAGTEGGQLIESFKKWAGTADGAIINGEKSLDKRAAKWAAKNVTIKNDVVNVSKKLSEMTNSTVNKALKMMGDDGTIVAKPIVKTHADIVSQVENSLAKEFSSVGTQFTRSDADFLATLVENKTPVELISDEIEHRLKHGKFFPITYDVVVKPETSKRLDSILETLEISDNVKKPTVLSHEELKQRVKNSFANELAGIEYKFEDREAEFITQLLENKAVKRQDIKDEIKYFLRNGDFYALDESLPIKAETNKRLKTIVNKMMKPETTAKVVEQPTHFQLREQVKNTLTEKFGKKYEFTEEDFDFVANLMENGATASDISNMITTRLATGKWGISSDVVEKVNGLFDLASLKDINSKERVDLENQAFALIADDLYPKGASFFERFDEWRYLAMLGNTKTHLRNINSNALFGVETSAANSIAAVIESSVDNTSKFFGGEGIERTKAVLNPLNKSDDALLKGALGDANEAAYRQLSGDKYGKDIARAIDSQKNTFKSKALNALSKGNSKLLELEDSVATHTKYATSLSGYLKANGLDSSVFNAERRLKQLENSVDFLNSGRKEEIEELRRQIDILNKGREYAIKEANYAAFHEDNWFAQKISKFVADSKQSDKVAERVAGTAVQGIIPFAKTPANVLRSGVEFSPLNAVKNITDISKLRKGSITASEYISDVSKTLTGMLMAYLGAYLYDNDVLIVKGDPNTEAFEENQGIQHYALKLGGKTYTVDWAAPVIMPVIMGAEIKKIIDKNNSMSNEDFYNSMDDPETEKKINLLKVNDIVNASLNIIDPVFETSYMSGINDALETLSYDGIENAAVDLLGNTLTGYFTQGIPTAFGQAARAIDNTRRSTRAENEGFVGQVERQINKVENKIPFLSKTNNAYIDLWGRKQTNYDGNFLQNLGYQMFSPSYVETINTTPVDAEISKLYSDTKLKSVVPSGYTSTINGRKMTGDEYEKYSTTVGTSRYAVLDALFKSDFYKNSSNEAKERMISSVYSFANEKGRYAIDGEKEDASAIYKAYKEKGITGVLNYIDEKEAFKSVGLTRSDKVEDIYKNEGLEGLQSYADNYFLAKDNGLKYNDNVENVLNTFGEDALPLYKSVTETDSKNGNNILPVLESANLSDAEIGQWLATTANLTKTGQMFADSGAYEALATYYRIRKNADLDGNGSVKKDELIPYLESVGLDTDTWGKLNY